MVLMSTIMLLVVSRKVRGRSPGDQGRCSGRGGARPGVQRRSLSGKLWKMFEIWHCMTACDQVVVFTSLLAEGGVGEGGEGGNVNTYPGQHNLSRW